MTQPEQNDNPGGPLGLGRRDRELAVVFSQLTRPERQLLTAALAGNHPQSLSECRRDVIAGLARADDRDHRAFVKAVS